MKQRTIRCVLALLSGPLVVMVLCGTCFAGEPVPQTQGTSAVVSAETTTADAAGKGFVGWIWNELTDEASVTVGYGIMKWVLDIERTSDGASGRLVQRDDSALYLSYSTKPFFFKGSNFGYTIMVNYHDFDMTKQEIENDQFADLGTEMHGYVIYAVPTLYYQWGEHRRKGRFVRLGVGAGVGTARFSGTVRLSTGEIVHTSQNKMEPRLAITNFLTAQWDHAGIQFSLAAPRVYGDGYDARVTDVSLFATYTIHF